MAHNGCPYPRVAERVGRGWNAIERNTFALRYDGGAAAYFAIVVPPGETETAIPGVAYVSGARRARVP